jgi:hypothetical protein
MFVERENAVWGDISPYAIWMIDFQSSPMLGSTISAAT